MPMSLEQSVRLYREQMAQNLDAARGWKFRGNRGRELFCLYQALQNSLCVAVSDYEAPQSGIEYLQAEFKAEIFDRTLELIRRLHLGGEMRSENIGAPGLFQLVLTVHAAWLLGLFAEAEEIASVCGDEEQQRFYQRDVLWRDYARGMAAVARRGQFAPLPKKYKGYDHHWATYLQLMADICEGSDLAPAIAAVDQSFAQRNRDRRLISDGLDGDGTFPVKWDFRKHSLLAAAHYNAEIAG